MPTYEYECTSCSKSFEAFQSMMAPALKDCPSCGGRVRRKIFGGIGVIFKGSGFYKNDSRAKPSQGPAKIQEKEKAAESSSPASTTEASKATSAEAPSSKTPSPAPAGQSPAASPAPKS